MDDGLVATPGGDDTFIYSSVDGNLGIQAHSSSVHFDTLRFTDLNASDVTFSRNGGDLLVSVNATGKTVSVGGEFNSTRRDGIQQIVFANGATLDGAQIRTAALASRPETGETNSTFTIVPATMAPGTEIRTATGDFRLAFQNDGNIVIYNAAGAPVWASNTQGRDPGRLDMQDDGNFVAYDPNGTPYWASGTDRHDGAVATLSEDGVLRVCNPDGSQIFWHSTDVLIGTSGDDRITYSGRGSINLGRGNDVGFFQRAGDVTVRFGKGDGNDLYYHGSTSDLHSATLMLTDIDRSDVQFLLNPAYTHNGAVPNDILMKVLSTGDSVDLGHENEPAFAAFQNIVFADGTIIDRNEILAEAVRAGTDQNDALDFGGSGNIDLGKGDDVVRFYAGGDFNQAGDVTVVFRKGDGHDAYYAASPADLKGATLKLVDIERSDVRLVFNPNYLHSGAVPNDILLQVVSTGDSVNFGQENQPEFRAFQKIVFADGTSIDRNEILAEAVVAGTDQNDSFSFGGRGTIDLGKGDDVVRFDAGNDPNQAGDVKVVYRLGDGHDTYYAGNPADLKRATLELVGVDPNDVTLGINPIYNNDVLVGLKTTGGSVDLGHELERNFGAFESIEFDNGLTWNRDDIIAGAKPYLAGDADHVIVDAKTANATLVAGHGDDQLISHYGDNTFVYTAADGNLGMDAHSTVPNMNTLSLSDLNASDLTFSKNGGDLLIGVNATSHAITIAGEFNTGEQDGVQQIAFGDGSKWDRSQIAATAQPAN